MTRRINYLGAADSRRILRSQIIGVGLPDPGVDLVWSKANSYELDVPDVTAAWLIAADGAFVDDAGMDFGDIIGVSGAVPLAPINADEFVINADGTMGPGPNMGRVRWVYQDADQSVNNTTAKVAASGLVLDVEANKKYAMESLLMYRADDLADFSWNFVGPTGATMVWAIRGHGTSAGEDASQASVYNGVASTINASGIASGGIGVDAPGDRVGIGPSGFLEIAATGGTLQLWFAQNSAQLNDCTLLRGSWLKLTEFVA